MLTNFGELGSSIAEIVSLGALPGAQRWSKFGSGVVGTSYSTIFSNPTSGLLTYLDAPQKVSIASTDPDDNTLGVGAHNILLRGLDTDGNQQEEIFLLQGQTPVESQFVYSRVTRLINISRHPFSLQGQLYVGPNDAIWTAGEPDHILGHVNDGLNQSQMAFDTVPKGYYLFAYSTVLCADNSKAFDVGLYARDADVTDLTNSGVFAMKVNWLLYQNAISIPLASNPFVLPPLTDFEFRAKVDTGTGKITANATGVLIPEKYINEA